MTIASPADGVVRRGEALDLAIGPSVDAAPVWIGVSQGVLSSDGTHYVQAFPWQPESPTEELVVDDTHLRYIVPLDAPLGRPTCI